MNDERTDRALARVRREVPPAPEQSMPATPQSTSRRAVASLIPKQTSRA